MPVKNIVSQHQGAGRACQKILTNDDSLRQAIKDNTVPIPPELEPFKALIIERLRKLAGGGVTIGRLEGHRAGHRALDVFRNGGAHIAKRTRRLGEALGHHALRRRRAEGSLAGEHFIEHAGQAVLVAATVQVQVACGLLGACARTPLV